MRAHADSVRDEGEELISSILSSLETGTRKDWEEAEREKESSLGKLSKGSTEEGKSEQAAATHARTNSVLVSKIRKDFNRATQKKERPGRGGQLNKKIDKVIEMLSKTLCNNTQSQA